MKMKKRGIIQQIGTLEEKHCYNCKLVKTFPSDKVALNCVTKCDIGKQLRNLGDKLLGVWNDEPTTLSESISLSPANEITNAITWWYPVGYWMYTI